MAGPRKHSLTLRGHRTSVSLEDEFWAALDDAARSEGLSVNALCAQIDADRSPETALASAIRVWLLDRALTGR